MQRMGVVMMVGLAQSLSLAYTRQTVEMAAFDMSLLNHRHPHPHPHHRLQKAPSHRCCHAP